MVISALYNNGCDFGINGGKKPDTQLDDKVPPINAGIFLSFESAMGDSQIRKFAFFTNCESNSQIRTLYNDLYF